MNLFALFAFVVGVTVTTGQITPIDGNWTEWTVTTGNCSASCGGGSRTISRTRTCTNPAPSNGGADCVGSATGDYLENCNTVGYPVDGNWTEWAVTTGACSVPCGEGSRAITRTRTCTNPAPSNGGADCVGSDREDDTETCNSTCPVGDPCDGCRYDNGVGYMPDETDCARFYQCVRPGTTVSSHHKTCPPGLYWNQGVLVCDWPANVQCTAGSVATTSSTVQNNVPSACDGSIRGSSGDPAKYEKLDHGIWTEMPCPPGTTYSSTTCTCVSGGSLLAAVDGNWTEWTVTTGDCSASYGRGSRTISRTRTCTNPAPSNGGADCVGSATGDYSENCNTVGYPVDGNWTEWAVTTGACSVPCGEGSRAITRTRTCTNPAPSNGGADCVGSDREDVTETCNSTCPVGDPCDGCRYDNGVGYMPDETDCARFYQCVRPGTTVSSHHKTCPPGLYWNQGVLVCDWPANVQCTAGSVATTSSTVQNNVPSACDGSIRGSSADPAKYEKLDHGIWTEMPCPPGTTYSSTTCTCVSGGSLLAAVDGNWTEWTVTTGDCSASYGRGSRTISRTRTCTNPAPSNGGADCVGSATGDYSENCNTVGYPVDGNWTEWAVTTGACSVPCGEGSRAITRTRTCTNPAPSNGGADCVGSDREDDTETCNSTCPVGDPCDGCRYDNGVGYMPDETDCARFYQCVRPGTTVSSHHKTCPPGLYWNQGVLVCDWPANVQCTAGSVATTSSTVQNNVPSACDGSIRGSSGDQAKYEKLDHGIWTEMPCPPGTTYSSTTCTCVSGGSLLAAVCKAELYLPFNGTVQDYSGYNVAVQNVGVSAFSGYGIFNNNIQLRILRFSNMHFGNVLVISFLFRQTQATSNAQAIVTNADCEEAGSIYITTSTSTVSFRVINDGGVIHELSVSYSNTIAMNSVKLTVNNNLMKAEVNSVSDQRTFSGNIRRSQCAIQVGHGNGYDFFHGQLDELKVYTCIPTPLLTK
ncbi:SCO-spondin-like [Haliotis rufescens]|uniref:SCO-spondin-like n=1 Tax=Haliotis rufescens TaxID=6454 RepID=UPI00201F7D58|nr:SCO-spondin-like [Haliotis rufescens]